MAKYNYIIAGGSGFYKVAYSDLFKMPNVAYFCNYVDGLESKLRQLLLRGNFNLKLNRYVKTPLARVVYPWLFPHSFNNNLPLCFIFFEAQFAVINTSYIEYLRRVHPSAKLVLYMQDIVGSLPYYDIENYKNRFDLVLSYDKGDCKRYGLEYYPTPYSRINLNNVYNEEFDVFFCGAGKTRYKTILDTYVQLTAQNLKCKFFITGVPQKERIEGDGLIYDSPISYMDNLKYVLASKCILEVMQVNADGYTPRLWEAIMYDKHLLTNNSYIPNTNYWNPSGMHLLTECNDFSFINNPVTYSEDIKKSKSPVNLLYFIEKHLC